AAAPEERHVSPPRIVRPDAQRLADATARGGERAVRMHDGLRLRGGAGGEEDGGDVGGRHAALDGVEKGVVKGVVARRDELAPALRAACAAAPARTRREEDHA